MWKIEWSCVDCGKQFVVSVPEPRSATLRDGRCIRTFIAEFDLPQEAQFYGADYVRCYDCGKKRWDTVYAESQRKRAEAFEATVVEYAALASTDLKALAELLLKEDNLDGHRKGNVRAIAEALRRSA